MTTITKAGRLFLFPTSLILVAIALCCGAAFAQGATAGDAGMSTFTGGSPAPILLSQGRVSSGTILPTDITPTPIGQERMTVGENFQIRVLQHLPSRFFLNANVEGSVRNETNPFQFPTKRTFLQKRLPPPPVIATLNAFQQGQILNALGQTSAFDTVFRIAPNLTWGWALGPRTRLYGNYFMIRDQLTHFTVLNTVVHSIGYGIQHDQQLTRKLSLQFNQQFRELYILHQKPVFDFLPSLTLAYAINPRTVAFLNTTLQLRGKWYFQAPTREIDPFYTVGFVHRRGRWVFSNTCTFLQNFREPFGNNALVRQDNYTFILDFEVARSLVKELPGFQAFVRAEPVYNFHSRNFPGLSGMDMRIFYGLRMSLNKTPLVASISRMREDLKEMEEGDIEEKEEKKKKAPPMQQKPSAFLPPHELIASTPQPMHGFIPVNSLSSNYSQLPVVAASEQQPAVLTTISAHGDR